MNRVRLASLASGFVLVGAWVAGCGGDSSASSGQSAAATATADTTAAADNGIASLGAKVTRESMEGDA